MKNPSVKQTELAEQTEQSVRNIKRIIGSLKEKQYIRRVDGKRYGKWKVSVGRICSNYRENQVTFKAEET